MPEEREMPPTTRRNWLRMAGATLLAAGPPAGRAGAQTADLVIFAAASLKTALDDVAGLYAKDNRKPAPKISYAASNMLARQIEQGAPADLFISADLDWMDYLAAKDLVRAGTRVSLLGNRIVLIASADNAATVALKPGLDLSPVLAGGRLAICNDAVPAGRYGKAALEKLGAWEGVKNHLATAENVRAALLLVSRGEAPAGIVYQTDAAADRSVKVLATFPEDLHPPIIYPVAILRDSVHPGAAGLLAFLRGPAARAAFEKQGFSVPNRAATGS